MNKINFQNGILVAKAKVTINGIVYEVEPAEYEGTTPLNAENLNQIQTNAENAINTVQSNLNTTNQNIENLTTYSTTEKVVGTWIDGKPIYRKVITQNVSNMSSEVDINLGTTDVGVFVNGRVLVDTSDYTSIVNSQSTLTYYIRNFVFRKTNNTVTVATNITGISGTIYVIIEYTKTTD